MKAHSKYNSTSWLNTPFPLLKLNRQIIIVSILLSVFIYFFLLIFKPFDISNVETNIAAYLLGFFFITLLVSFLSFFLLPKIFPKLFDSDRWTILKNTILILFIMTIIGILNWAYHTSFDRSYVEYISLFDFLIITILVGITPSFILTLLIERYLSHSHSQTAKNIESNIKSWHADSPNFKIHIQSQNNSESFFMSIEELLCVKAVGNYVMVHYLDESNTVCKKLIRNSLNNIAKNLVGFDHLKRCHRSYIVNFNHISGVNGNARNYSLDLFSLEFSVPISRSFPKEMIKEMKEKE